MSRVPSKVKNPVVVSPRVEIMEESPPSRAEVIAIIATSLCSAATGFAFGYSAPALYSMTKDSEMEAGKIAIISWIFPFGGLLGSAVSAFLVQPCGRRTILVVSAPLFFVSYLMIYFASFLQSGDWLLALFGRALTGVSVGLISIAAHLYLEEIVQASTLRRLGLVPTVAGNLSIVFSYVIGSFVRWTILALVGAVYSILFIFLIFFIPESPVFHVDKGNMDEASNSLKRLNNGINLNEIIKIRESSSFKIDNVQPLFVTVGLLAFQQFSAANNIVFFSFDIFKEIPSDVDFRVASIIVAIVNVIATALAVLYATKIREPFNLFVSFFAISVTLATFGMAHYYLENYEDKNYTRDWLPLFCLILHSIAFSVGAGPAPWLRIDGLPPDKSRQSNISVVVVAYWILCSVSTCVFRVLWSSEIGISGAVWIFALISLGVLPVCSFVWIKKAGEPELNVPRSFDVLPAYDLTDISDSMKAALIIAVLTGMASQFRVFF